MKINKSLLEKKIINEENEDKVEPIIPTDSVDEIADEVQDQVVAISSGDEVINDANAQKVATEIKQVADEIDAGAAMLVSVDEPLGVKNAITDTLDAALSASRKNKRRGLKSGNNVLIVGLPGSGKTATVYD